jgi:hypothetical protein
VLADNSVCINLYQHGVNVVVVDNGETNGSLGGGERECDGYQYSTRVQTCIKMRCASVLEEVWTEARLWFLDEGLERFMGTVFMGTTFMGTDAEAEVGTLRGSVR